MEPISLFLSSFVELVDRITNLEKTKLQDRQTLFNEIVKPLFEEAEPVATYYIEIFRNARKIISESSEQNIQAFANTLSIIEEDRQAMLLSRIKVNEMAKQIKEYIEDDEVVKLAIAVNYFFFALLSASQSLSVSLLFRIRENLMQTEKVKIETITFIDEILSDLEKLWGEVVQTYEKLKIVSVSPPKYIRKSQAIKNKSKK